MDAAGREILLRSLTSDAERIARHFGLRYKSIGAERANVRSRYGVCFADGSIRIRLRHAVTGRPLKYSSLVNTLCHELAHLRHFNHGVRFKSFYFELLDFARVRGIYRPGVRIAAEAAVRAPRIAEAPSRAITTSAPVQLALL
ncbi:MAG TPA: M48 family metallopeptidase [Myxococcota bacterium]|nr:M48 family metallopeptidase [Myxococcota bacterium]